MSCGNVREHLREWILAICYVPSCQGRYYLCFQVSFEGLGCSKLAFMVREVFKLVAGRSGICAGQ